eukprot:6731533-Pyramimonas_sp.AAC.1
MKRKFFSNMSSTSASRLCKAWCINTQLIWKVKMYTTYVRACVVRPTRSGMQTEYENVMLHACDGLPPANCRVAEKSHCLLHGFARGAHPLFHVDSYAGPDKNTLHLIGHVM